MPIFPFVQFEFTSAIGPPEGRYVVSRNGAMPTGRQPDVGSADVLVIQTWGAPPARQGIVRRKPVRDDDGNLREVPVVLATVVRATQEVQGNREGDALLRRLEDPDARDAFVAEALGMVMHAVSGYRACAADWHVADISSADARVVRIGYGLAEEVYKSKWTRAQTVLPPREPKVPRQVKLMPEQGLAAVLAGQARVLESEEMVLRVLTDLEHDRYRGAAVGLEASLELLRGELAGEVLTGKTLQGLEDVVERREDIQQLAATARRGELRSEDTKLLAELAEQVGAVIDRWRYEPLGF